MSFLLGLLQYVLWAVIIGLVLEYGFGYDVLETMLEYVAKALSWGLL